MIVGEAWIEPYAGNDDPSSKRDLASLADTRIIDDWPVAPQLTNWTEDRVALSTRSSISTRDLSKSSPAPMSSMRIRIASG